MSALTCPRCNSVKFEHIDCGADSYDDDISYTSSICTACGLYHDGWHDRWLLNCAGCGGEEFATEYKE